MGLPPRPTFASVRDYGQRFTDADYWRPYVAAICARHDLGPCREVRSGLPGTYPVFIVDGRIVVKLFGELFNGGVGFRTELAVYELLAADRAIPAPALIASGELFGGDDGWRWPYLIAEFLPGTSLGEVAERVRFQNRLAISRFLGRTVRRIHALRLARDSSLAPTWDAFDRFLAGRRAACAANHRAWGSLPARLVAQIDRYLPPPSELIDHEATPHLLHCDLNADHVLGDFADGHWHPTGIIDFGDAKVGDRPYELVALHLGLFRCDKRLLRAFLDEYGFDGSLRQDFALRAMSMTLLHEFDVLSSVFPPFPAAAQATSLDELAALLWDLERPGLPPLPPT